MPDRAPIYCHGSQFKLGRRLHSLPRGKDQPPFPLSDLGIRGGIELRSFAYFAAAVGLMWLLRHLPVVNVIAGIGPWELAYVILPAFVAYKLTVLEPAGRPVRNWLGTMILHMVTPAQKSAGRPLSPEGVPVLHTGLTAVAVHPGDSRLRKSVIVGPVDVAFEQHVRLAERRDGRIVCRPAGRGKGVEATNVTLAVGEGLEIRP